MSGLEGVGRVGRAGTCVLLVVLGSIGSRAAGGEFPIVLRDPVADSEVRLEPGAPALHVVFFATWCPPCLEELDRLAMIEARWEEHGYRLVLIAVRTRQSPSRLEGFVREKRPPGRLLFDARGQAVGLFGGGELPTHLLFDGSGREVLRTGSLDGKMEGAIEELLLPDERAPVDRP